MSEENKQQTETRETSSFQLTDEDIKKLEKLGYNSEEIANIKSKEALDSAMSTSKTDKNPGTNVDKLEKTQEGEKKTSRK